MNKESDRRTDVAGTTPNEATLLQLAGAVVLKIHDERAIVGAATSPTARWPSLSGRLSG